MARVLIVEDDSDAMYALERMVARAGAHDCITARNGEEGLEALAKKPQIILCDYHMPRMTGGEFLRHLKTDERYGSYADIPVIGIGDFPYDEQELLTRYVPKQMLRVLLRTTIEQYAKKD
jgi:CheY-like chemotaxis protein